MKRMIVALFLILLFTSMAFADIEGFHRDILYPTVRIRSGNSVGSGTIIASLPNGARFDTYVLTNFHVVESSITISEQWDSLKKENIKRERRATIEVEKFVYQNMSVATGTLLILADIVEWNKDHDIALIKLRADEKLTPVKLLHFNKIENLRIFMPVIICGAGLGRSPFPTHGLIASLTDEIDNYPYWMMSAPAVFGNSGGGAFLFETGEFIGVPSRLAVTFALWSPNAVYHMNYIIPISRIYSWLTETGWGFLYNPKAPSRERWLEERRPKK